MEDYKEDKIEENIASNISELESSLFKKEEKLSLIKERQGLLKSTFNKSPKHKKINREISRLEDKIEKERGKLYDISDESSSFWFYFIVGVLGIIAIAAAIYSGLAILGVATILIIIGGIGWVIMKLSYI